MALSSSGMVRYGCTVGAALALSLTAACTSNHAATGPSAADVAAERGPSTLEFFDELERRPVAQQDDMLHGMLLVMGEQSPQSSRQRVDAARRAGIVGAGYSRSPSDPVTVHEASVAASRVVGGPGAKDYATWEANAADWARRSGLVPAEARATDVLSGAQLLAILGGVADMRASSGSAATAAPAPAADDEFDKFSTTTAPTPAPKTAPKAPPAPQPVSATSSGLPQARTEPLPPMTMVQPSTVALPDATPSAEPARTVETPPAPSAAPAAPGVSVPKPKANPWSSGRPINTGK